MNAFGLDIGKLDSFDLQETFASEASGYEKLPGVPSIMTRTELAAVSGVSMPTIERLLASGDIPEVNLPGGDSGILKSDFIAFIEANLLCNRPLID
jgi:hypothetical protein